MTESRDRSVIVQELNERMVELAIHDGMGDEGDYPVDWILIADVNNLEMGSTGDGYYLLAQRKISGTPAHIVKGLLTQATDMVAELEYQKKEEDEE